MVRKPFGLRRGRFTYVATSLRRRRRLVLTFRSDARQDRSEHFIARRASNRALRTVRVLSASETWRSGSGFRARQNSGWQREGDHSSPRTNQGNGRKNSDDPKRKKRRITSDR